MITLITNFSEGNLVYTHLFLVMVLGYVCRGCAEKQGAEEALRPTH